MSGPGKTPSEPLDLSGLTTYPLADRVSKVALSDFARPHRPGASVAEFLDALPRLDYGEP